MNKLLSQSKRFLKRNSSTILTCVGAAGVIATTITAVKATPKAMLLIQNAEEEKGEKLTKLEVVQVAGPVYIPSIMIGASTIACIFGANALNKRSQAALMSAYALVDNSFKEYKNKVSELYGEETDMRIREELAKDKYEESGIVAEDEKQLFYDEYSKRYFNSTMEDVTKAEYNLNRALALSDYACLNEFYDLLGLPRTDYGDDLGWSVFQLVEMYWHSWIDFHHEKVVMDDGLECYIITMVHPPEDDFTDY